ncbi:CTB family bacteriocin [Cylindrospermum sp. FACHB-282]|uniref:CTB family bacteriocin n=1 Tax=Cylindrospermum sp. FACHB-282 TaxID=2692794 RepID=UPI001684F030|nr:CTB family bacteriocin [Cylindrospermum sp. FACHB-282]MBD2385678.1 hypothetical protein [Cylindrospermum sp. FACHB-282]
MSHLIMAVELFVDLCEEQQELLVGSASSEQSNSNFTQDVVNQQGTTTSGPLGNTSNTRLQKNYISNSAQALLGSGAAIPTDIGALAPAPMLGADVAPVAANPG